MVKIGYIKGKMAFKKKKKKSHERTVRRRADSRLTRTSEIMRGKRMSHLKKQKQKFRVYRLKFRNAQAVRN